MKFSDLEVGQQFLYKGMELEKSGPLQAVEKTTGTEKIIMRAAVVTLLNKQTGDAVDARASLDELKQVLAAYHQTALSLLQARQEPETERRVEEAYREVLQVVDRLPEPKK